MFNPKHDMNMSSENEEAKSGRGDDEMPKLAALWDGTSSEWIPQDGFESLDLDAGFQYDIEGVISAVGGVSISRHLQAADNTCDSCRAGDDCGGSVNVCQAAAGSRNIEGEASNQEPLTCEMPAHRSSLPPPTHAAMQDDPIDLTDLKERCDGDDSLLVEVLENFFSQGTAHCQSIENALSAGNMEQMLFDAVSAEASSLSVCTRSFVFPE